MANAPLPQLPRYAGTDPAVKLWADALCRTIEAWSHTLGAPVGEPWIVNGTTAARDVDPAVITTIPQVVNALGSLVRDLSRGAPVSVT